MEAEDSITGSLITQSGVQVSPQHSVVHAVQQSAVQVPIVGEALLTSSLLLLSHLHGSSGMFSAALVDELLGTKKR